MTTIRVRAVRDVPLALDGIHVRTYRAGDEFAAPERVVRGQIGLGALEEPVPVAGPAAVPAPVREAPAPAPAEPGAYEAKPAAYEQGVQRPRRSRR